MVNDFYSIPCDVWHVLKEKYTKIMKINGATSEFQLIHIDTPDKSKCEDFYDWIQIFIDEGNIHPDISKRLRPLIIVHF